MLSGRVLLTGGTGFLGRGIMRKAMRENWPCEFTVLSRDEYKQDLCKQKYPNAKYILGDITDSDRLYTAFRNVDTVVHAAALKYIPEAELNVDECIRVNVEGSANVFKHARWANVKNVVAISTDKAPLPVNVYGMTKALMERMIGEQSRFGDTKYTAARYGNVIGSTGSVIPLFQRQLERQQQVVVTNPDMTRFWITIDEAVQLIEDAVDCTVNGGVVIPSPQAMSIGDLALAMTTYYYGAKPKIIGTRIGERMHETLLTVDECRRTTIVGDRYVLLPVHATYSNNITALFELVSNNVTKIEPEDIIQYIIDAETV